MKPKIMCVLLSLLTIFSTNSVASGDDQKISILQIFDQFVMSSKAARKCTELG